METTTTLESSPDPEVFMDSMILGGSMDAVTGEIRPSAIDRSTIKTEQVPSGASGEHQKFQMIEDVRSLEDSATLNMSASMTIPYSGLNITAKEGIDFSNTNISQGSSLLFLLTWERVGGIERLVDGVVGLKPDAIEKVVKDPDGFRKSYGDYYISQIQSKARFSAMWKCTASSQSSLKSFKDSLGLDVNALGNIGGSAKFQSSLTKAASANHVSWDVQFDTVGDAGKTVFDTSDVTKTFDSFRANCTPVPALVWYRHYSWLDNRLPRTINMDPGTFDLLVNVFAKARFVLFLNGIAPGKQATRRDRSNRIKSAFSMIHARRAQYYNGSSALQAPLKELDDLKTELLRLLDRQDLVTQLRGQTYKDLKSQFQVYNEDDHGSWIASNQGDRNTWTFGTTHYSDADAQKWAIQKVVAQTVKVPGHLLDERRGLLSFPGDSSASGTVVGVELKDNGGTGNGNGSYWCVPKTNPLGDKNCRIEVKTFRGRGMNWSLTVHYIKDEDFEG
ncbi:hypothetical protein JAAARDRAFT_207204 [Jaapia argillacea MUCL 33604]|uniref:MACPF domain-containing protein n=1 Tax=Jaapia argillacea MUCL 33604 TaxID=933084 RepID=A0A067PSD0_9AGAM|nr:hypothetical protein JAAARDRAFT_207204 [Jaapia argillacea MUCL 33604]